jgi:predicted GH43/DUF377 family glycosyl hydrolase
MFPENNLLSAKAILFVAVAGISACSQAADSAAYGLPDGVQPTIGAWFCSDDFLEPNGYKKYVDLFAERSPYDLLTTSFRVNRREITEAAFHDQVKSAVAYARERGLKIALDLDVRLAREAFRSQHPNEQQEMLRLRTVPLQASGEVEFVLEPETLTDHMTGNTTPYVPLSGRLVRVYSYTTGEGGILPESVQDITAQCVVKNASEKEVGVVIPCDASTDGRTACVMAAFALLTPDVYAPHLLDFQRSLVEQYADVALSGLMKDEWGFPPCHGGCPAKNDFWFSEARAKAYAGATGGRDLVRDCLLMHAGEQGRERERQAAVNVLLKTSRERNVAIEEHYYNLAKEFFGPNAAVVTHATWVAYPGPSEFKKNGLDWWAAKRDWGQTDEEAPFAARTALAKKWGSPVWYNQYYATDADKYRESLWTHAMGGGRINYHPIYPAPENMGRMDRIANLLAPDIVAGESRIRLLQLITHAPIDCPVAVVFGHACAMNWAGPAYDEVGLDVTDALWQAGYYADLIPTSEIESGALKVSDDGAVTYGRQRYAAVVLYHPEFEQPETAAFFNKASATALFRVGDWTRNFSARDFNGVAALPPSMAECSDAANAAAKAIEALQKHGIAPCTPATEHLSNKTASPGREGHIRLTDGTEVFLSGKTDTAGDPITGSFEVSGRKVTANAKGVLAVRFTADGKMDALAAGGLTEFACEGFSLRFDMPVDIAYWHNEEGHAKVALQDAPDTALETVAALSGDCIRLSTPAAAAPAPANVTAALPFPPELVSFTPYEHNPVFEAAGPGHWDENIRERGWIMYEDNAYHLWYTGYLSRGDETRKLGYATSGDGIHWERYPGNPIISDVWAEDVNIVKVDGTYHMFSEGKNDEAHLLTSTDRIHWSEQGKLDIRKTNGKPIAPGPFGTPAAYHENGTWYLFYERNDVAIWLAASKDLKTWTNVQDEPVLKCGPQSYDKKMIAMDQIVKYNGVYYAYYHGLVPNTKPADWTSAVAASKDLIHWEKYSGNPIVRGDKSSPVLVRDGTGCRLYTMHPAVCLYLPTQSGAAPAPAAQSPENAVLK